MSFLKGKKEKKEKKEHKEERKSKIFQTLRAFSKGKSSEESKSANTTLDERNRSRTVAEKKTPSADSAKTRYRSPIH